MNYYHTDDNYIAEEVVDMIGTLQNSLAGRVEKY